MSPNAGGVGHLISLSLSNGKTCSTSKESNFFITTAEPFSISSTISSLFYRQSDSQYVSPQCTHTNANDIITCDISTIPEGISSVKSITANGDQRLNMDLSQMTSNVVKFNSTTIIGEQKRTKPFYINSNNPTFEIILDAVHTKQPKIYSDISLQNEIPCTRQGVLMTCTPDLSTLTQDTEYIVYYKDFCDEAIDTTVSFIYNENLIFVTGITVTENSQYSNGEISTFLIKTRDLPSGAISNVELTHQKGGSIVQVDSCSVSETVRYTIECDASNLSEGSYSLQSITGDKTYNLEEMSSNFMKISNIQLGIQIVTAPVVNSSKQFFNVILTSGNINTVYLDSDKTNEIPCTKMTDYYQCSPVLSSLTEGQTYEIFYENNLDELVSTGIIIEKVSDSTEIHSIDSITLSNGNTCTLSSFSDVVIQTDSQTTKETSAKVKIINKEDGTSFTTSTCVQSQNDEGTKDILTCNIPEGTTLTEGTYYISSLIGVNKYYLYDINGIEMTTEITPVSSSQNPQTIKGSVRTFTVNLIDGVTSKPLIYLDNDKGNEVSCEIDPNFDTTLI